MPYLGRAKLRDTNETAQMQIPIAVQPKLRLIAASIARIGDLPQEGAVAAGLLVGDDGQAALRPSVDVGRHRLRRLPVDADDAAAQRFAALVDRDDAMAVRGRPRPDRSAADGVVRETR